MAYQRFNWDLFDLRKTGIVSHDLDVFALVYLHLKVYVLSIFFYSVVCASKMPESLLKKKVSLP